jgi:hypothetical protein
MVYMQQQVADDAVFHPDAVRAAINGNRMAGIMPKGMVNCRERGMEGLVVMAGLDPATSGCTAAVCIGLDLSTNKRYVLDVYNKAGTSPEGIRDVIKQWTDKYGIIEWRIEKNGFQGFLVHDREVNEFCSNRGTIIRPHFTGANKHDSDFGVAAMTTLFSGYEDGNQMIELPSTQGQESMKQFIEQLVTWAPSAPKGQKTDIVMALWFAELACRDRVLLASNFAKHNTKNPFLTPWDKKGQITIDLVDLEARRAWMTVGA